MAGFKVAVIGTTGKVARKAIMQLSQKGVSVKCLLRHELPVGPKPTTLTADMSSKEVAAYLSNLKGVEMVKGDVNDVDSLKELMKDCSVCLALYGPVRRSKWSDLFNSHVEEEPTHPQQICYNGVKNIIEAAKDSKTCKRIVRITGKGEDPKGFFTVLINMLGNMAKGWNYEGETLLRAEKDVDYTIIRPGIMKDDGPTGKVLVLKDDGGGGDLPVSSIRAQDIATLCVECLEYPNAARATLSAMTTEEGKGEATFGPLLKKVQPDRRSFPPTLIAEHKSAVKSFTLKLVAGGVVSVAIAVQLGRMALK